MATTTVGPPPFPPFISPLIDKDPTCLSLLCGECQNTAGRRSLIAHTFRFPGVPFFSGGRPEKHNKTHNRTQDKPTTPPPPPHLHPLHTKNPTPTVKHEQKNPPPPTHKPQNKNQQSTNTQPTNPTPRPPKKTHLKNHNTKNPQPPPQTKSTQPNPKPTNPHPPPPPPHNKHPRGLEQPSFPQERWLLRFEDLVASLPWLAHPPFLASHVEHSESFSSCIFLSCTRTPLTSPVLHGTTMLSFLVLCIKVCS